MTLSILENITIEKRDVQGLQKAWAAIKDAKPGVRIRDAANMLDVSEAELLATNIGENCIRLTGNWAELVERLKTLGKVMSLTRNENCVLEHKGNFEKVNVFGGGNHKMATVIGSIETRYFLHNWYVGFAVKEQKKERLLTSLQIFDQSGEAITKIYLERNCDYDAYEKLVHDFKSSDQSTAQTITKAKEEIFNENPDKVDFLTDWANLKDTHDFFPMLRKFKVSRYQAMELALDVYTTPIKPQRITEILKVCSNIQLPIMIFVGNKGSIQIHQDVIKKITMMELENPVLENWLNIMDPSFNMHLKLTSVTHAWIVKKPTKDGTITSIELYDINQELVVQFFGLRKEGNQEDPTWTKLATK